MIELSWWQWAIGAFCAFLVGVAKTGVPGLGILVVPLMALMVGNAKNPRDGCCRCFARRTFSRFCIGGGAQAIWKFFTLAPWVAAGMVTGAIALTLNERFLRPIVGGIVFVMLTIYLVRRFRSSGSEVSSHAPTYGVTAGFATMVANAAGPVMNLYLLSKRLGKEEFIATGAWFFFVINLSKVPVYLWHGMISRRSLAFDAVLVPAVVMGAMTGRWIVHRIPQKAFEAAVVILTAVSTLMLFR